MKEQELRNMIKEEILNRLNENPDAFSKTLGGASRSKLGRAKQPLDMALSKIDVDRMSKLPRQQKVGLLISLLQSVGINSKDFAAIRQRVGRGLDQQ